MIKNSNSGFTLVETLVSLLIFTVSVAAMLFVTSQGVTNTTYSKNKIVATYLSEQGIEIVRFTRDSEVLGDSKNGWSSFTQIIKNCESSLCSADPASVLSGDYGNAILNTPSEIYYSDADGYTFNSSNTDSGFVVSISAKEVGGSADKIQITSTVSWKQGSSNYSVSSSEILFNWPIL